MTDRINLTPVAIAEGRAVAETLFNDNPIRMDHANVPSAVFSQPPIGAVGLTEAEARRQYGEVDIYCARFKPMKNTLSGRDERTLMKLVVDARTERVLGCHMLGPDAPEITAGSGDRGEMRRLEAHVRRDRRHPPERRRGIRDDAREGSPLKDGGGIARGVALENSSVQKHIDIFLQCRPSKRCVGLLGSKPRSRTRPAASARV